MNKLSALALLLNISFSISAQDITISFQPKESVTIVDSILVTNLKTNQRVKILGNESLVLSKTTGIDDLSFLNDRGYIFPNPCNGDVSLNFTTINNQEVELKVHNISGQLLLLRRGKLIAGQHLFKIGFPTNGIYTISVIKNDGPLSFKVMSNGNKCQKGFIEYEGNESSKQIKNAVLGNILSYTQGEILHYSCFSGINNTILTDSPTTSKTYTVEFYGCIDSAGQNYPVVQIGDQWWMAKNLAYLPQIMNPEGGSNTNPFYYVYGFSGGNISQAKVSDGYLTYGVLYNHPAAKSACPQGWHLPNDSEWNKLVNYLILSGYNFDNTSTGNKIAKAMGAQVKWKESTTLGAVGNNSTTNNKSGFSGLPGAYRMFSGNLSSFGGIFGAWWSATSNSSDFGNYRYLFYEYSELWNGDDCAESGFSVRCVKD